MLCMEIGKKGWSGVGWGVVSAGYNEADNTSVHSRL